MTPALSAHDLLRALRPGPGAHAAAGPTGAGVESLDFEAMLRKVRSEGFQSGLGVSIAPGADLELTNDQMQRLAAAADVAQAHGASRALVTIDGMSLLLDVGVRTITGKVDIRPGVPVTGVDAVLHVPGAPGQAAAAIASSTGATIGGATSGGVSGPALTKSLPPRNPSLLAALSKLSAA
ncbi:MAG: hypothetical protein JNL50_07930 [Phycisphaerae bacterium]|nr:hypothetical protein [Phycisphaerae bacterium]